MIPDDAIDPEVTYEQWKRQYVWHVDQLPLLIETTGVLALPSIGVSRGGSAFDRPQVTGGGYYDSVPIRDGGATADSRELWALLWRYLGEVRRHLPAVPTIDRDVPENADTARRAAYTVTAWLAENVEHISDLHDIAPVEDDLFALIRRLRGRYSTAGTARRARPRTCTTCGEAAVIVDWTDGANGSPKPVQVGLCRSCGETYTEDTNHANRIPAATCERLCGIRGCISARPETECADHMNRTHEGENQ